MKRKCDDSNTTQVIHRNPFALSDDHSHHQSNEGLEVVIDFLEQIKDQKLQRDQEGNIISPGLGSQVQLILSLLNDSCLERSSLSRMDIAELIVPWDVKCLTFLQSGNLPPKEFDLHLLWKALALALEVLNGHESSHSLKGTLSTQNLNKLLPLAIQSVTLLHDTSARGFAAQSFTLLTEYFYVPTFELCCNTILLELAHKIEAFASFTNNRYVLSNQEFCSVVKSGLKLIRKVQKKGNSNPKKIFQTLSRESHLTAISIFLMVGVDDEECTNSVHNMMKDIVWEAFFHPPHHIEGFRAIHLNPPDISLASGSKALENFPRCYQGDLLKSIWSLVEGVKGYEQELAAYWLSVRLAEGMIVKTLEWQKLRIIEVGSAYDGWISRLMFQFWGNLFSTVLLQIECKPKGSKEVFLNPLIHCLKVLSEHNIYHPTDMDDEQINFSFLKRVSCRVFSLLKSTRSPILLEAFTYILHLNHLLIEDFLPELISIVTSLGESHEYLRTFFCNLFKVYRQLRQIDHLVQVFQSGLQLMTDIVPEDNSYSKFREVFAGAHLQSEISSSFTSIPFGQTTILFEFFNTCIQNYISSIDDNTSVKIEGIAIIVGFFVLFLKSIRLNEQVSKQLILHCQDTISGSGSILLEKSKLYPEISLYGIRLCSGALDLRNRSSFWTSESEGISSFALPSQLLSLLHGLHGIVTEDHFSMHSQLTDIKEIRFELQVLSFHRIQLLHSLNHEETLAITLQSKELSSMDQYVNEIRLLTDNVFSIAESIDNGSGDNLDITELSQFENPWVLLSQYLPIWTSYCKTRHIQLFLDWVFRSLSGLDERWISEVPYSPQNRRLHPESKSAATALLDDASFYENLSITSSFLSAGLRYIRSLLSKNCNFEEMLSPIDYLNDNGKGVIPLSILNTFANELEIQPFYESYNLQYFQSVLKVLRVLINGHFALRKSDTLEMHLGTLFVLDVTFRRFAQSRVKRSSEEAELLLNILAYNRILISKLIVEHEHMTVRTVLQCNQMAPTLIEGVFNSSQSTIRSFRLDESLVNSDVFMDASCTLLETLTFICYGGLSTFIFKFIKISIRSSPSDMKSITFRLLNNCVKGVKHANASNLETVSDFALDLLNEDNFSFPYKSGDQSSYLHIFVGNLLSIALSSKSVSSLNLTKFVESLEITKNSNEFNFYFAVLLKHGMLDDNLCAIFFRLISDDNFEYVDDTVLCKLLVATNETTLLEFLHCLLLTTAKKFNSKVSRVLQLVFENLKKLDRPDILANLGPEVLSHAIQSLTLKDTDNCHCVQNAADLITEIMHHKELIPIREKDVAFILSQITSCFQSMDSNFEIQKRHEIFFICCALTSSMLQRIPKLLYVCVSSLSLLLQKLFLFILEKFGNDCGVLVLDYAKAFTRLCEIMVGHKEIFKKYFLGLILDFIDAMKANMSPNLKNTLTPAAYALLEMLSDHEVNQIKTYLDPSGKELFRAFYESYLKCHVYNGKF